MLRMEVSEENMLSFRSVRLASYELFLYYAGTHNTD